MLRDTGEQNRGGVVARCRFGKAWKAGRFFAAYQSWRPVVTGEVAMSSEDGFFEISVDRRHGLANIRHQGKISLNNLNESVRQLAGSPDFARVTRGLTDLRKARGALTSDEIRSHVRVVMGCLPHDRVLRWAIIAQTNLAYGLSRVFDILLETGNARIDLQVFRDAYDAMVWLDLTENRNVS